jgi:Mn2+/Fe2+ NRAMP family transporter
MLMTNNRKIMGDKINSGWINALGWTTTIVVFAASTVLVVTWIL